MLFVFLLAACATDTTEMGGGSAAQSQTPASAAGARQSEDKQVSGGEREKLRSQVLAQQPGVTEDQIKQALAVRRHLRTPFRLAIYFVPAPPPPPADVHVHPWDVRTWQWLREDKDNFIQMGEALKSRKIISDYIVLADSLVAGQGITGIRLAAARTGADAVLVVNGAAAGEAADTPLSISYLLFLPVFFVPGTDYQASFAASAAVWDVRKPSIYLSSGADGAASAMDSPVLVDYPRLIKQAKSEALSGMTQDLTRQLTGLGAK